MIAEAVDYSPLTAREAEVAQLVGDSMSIGSIAKRLGISQRTVRAHIASAAQRIDGSGQPYHKVMRFAIERRIACQYAARG